MAKKALVLITNSFPFGKGETFVDNEIRYYSKFYPVYVVSIDNVCPQRFLNIPNNISIYQMPKLSRCNKIIWYLRSLLRQVFYEELLFLLKERNYFFSRLHSLIAFIGLGERVFIFLTKNISNKIEGHDTVCYSYWLHHGAYAAVRFKKKFSARAVARCHGYDLYADRYISNYLPLRFYLSSYLDVIFPISKHGLDYLKGNIFISKSCKLEVSRLGTFDYGIKSNVHLEGTLRLVSCSWIVSVKRVHRILETLQQIVDINIEWTHIGGGALKERLELDIEKLPKNIKVNLLGELTSTDIYKLYKENSYHIFVNVSESEGIPVSIMEASSFGIPVIATNVGGVGEIVENGYNGLLLNKDFLNRDLSVCLKSIACMVDNDYQTLRKHAREMWEERYNSSVNYSKFVRILNELF